MSGSVVRVHSLSQHERSENLRLDFKERCLEACESLGEAATRIGDHDNAIAWYSAAFDLNPASPEHIFMKRSEAYAAGGSWENALVDAKEVYSIMDLPEAQIQR